jgi:hypothetical protein
MPNNYHKGTELNNVRETWDQNERERIKTGSPSSTDKFERTIEEEALEYDNANKEERVLTGERASLNDDKGSEGSE